MRDQSLRITGEIVKVTAILACCFFWFDSRITESHSQVASAATEDIQETRRAVQTRISELEQWQTKARGELEAAHGQVREVENDLRESTEDKLRRESMREAFEIYEVEDAEGGAMKRSDVILKLHTLGFEDEYWIDTGVFQV